MRLDEAIPRVLGETIRRRMLLPRPQVVLRQESSRASALRRGRR